MLLAYTCTLYVQCICYYNKTNARLVMCLPMQVHEASGQPQIHPHWSGSCPWRCHLKAPPRSDVSQRRLCGARRYRGNDPPHVQCYNFEWKGHLQLAQRDSGVRCSQVAARVCHPATNCCVSSEPFHCLLTLSVKPHYIVPKAVLVRKLITCDNFFKSLRLPRKPLNLHWKCA